MMVTKRNGEHQEFSREKLAAGIHWVFMKNFGDLALSDGRALTIAAEIEYRLGKTFGVYVRTSEIEEWVVEALIDRGYVPLQ